MKKIAIFQKNTGNFEAFHWNISSSKNFFFSEEFPIS